MTLDPAYFTGMYARDPDPWGFRTRWYERRKRALTLASLPRERYGAVFEPGCSLGLLSAALAPRCAALLATDVVPATVEAARREVAGHPHVRVEQRSVPADWPAGRFDLVVVSELGYYLSRVDLAELAARSAAALTAEGELLACHWRHPVEDYPLGGEEAQSAFTALPGLERVVHHVEDDFVLDILARAPARSVAQRTGLVQGGPVP